jgi:2-methylcitrate dehydratase PrpD
VGAAAEIGRTAELNPIIAARNRGLPAAVKTAAEELMHACAQRAAASGDDPVVVALMALAQSGGGKNDRYQAALIAAAGAHSFPGATPFGALMALGETLSEGARLTAFAIGCEVNVRLAARLAPQAALGWEIAGIAGAMGSGVTAALLLDADEKMLAGAIGIASSMTLGQRVADGTPSERLIAGKASSNGVLAALLAQRGFTGPASPESPRGLCTVLGAANLTESLADFGARWTFA